jgi:hypothetical protein
LANYKICPSARYLKYALALLRQLIDCKAVMSSRLKRILWVGPLDALWHLLNFFGPALGVGLLVPLMAKLVWRHSLGRVSWRRLSLWATASSALGLIAGLVFFGHDGKMATYGLMLLACASTIWVAGFALRR